MTWYLHKYHRGSYWGSVAYRGSTFDQVDRKAAELARSHAARGWHYLVDDWLLATQRVRQTFQRR